MAITRVVHFEKGDVILHANRPAPTFFMLYSGTAEKRAVSASGQSDSKGPFAVS